MNDAKIIAVPEGEDLYDSIYEQLESDLLDPIIDDTYDELMGDPKEYKK
jgi:hypothetical protein